MNVKYVRLNDGTLLLFSKYVGLQHSEMAAMLFEALPDDVADAGFVDLFDDQFEVYGESLSLGKQAHGSTNRLLNDALWNGRLNIYEVGDTFQFYATTADRGEPIEVADLANLRRFKILV